MFDAYFKNYFWTFHLLVILGAGLLVARTVNAFVRGGLEVPPEQLIRSSAEAPATAAPVEEYAIARDAFLERNLLEALREDLVAEEEAKKATEEDEEEAGEFDESNCTAAGASVNLLGTVVYADPEESAAVFQKDDEVLILRPGDPFPDSGKVMRVKTRDVYLDRNGRCELVSLDDPETKKRSTPELAMKGREDEPDDSNIRKTKAGEYEIPKAEIDGALSNMSKLATQARIVPSFKDGKANGFKLFSIRPNSLYQKIGIQNGDIIQKINGFEMNSPEKALEIYGKLKDAQTVTVDLVRRGKSMTLTYNIR